MDGDGEVVNRTRTKHQTERLKEAARDAGADMTKEEFTCVVGGLSKPKHEEKPEKNQEAEDTS